MANLQLQYTQWHLCTALVRDSRVWAGSFCSQGWKGGGSFAYGFTTGITCAVLASGCFGAGFSASAWGSSAVAGASSAGGEDACETPSGLSPSTSSAEMLCSATTGRSCALPSPASVAADPCPCKTPTHFDIAMVPYEMMWWVYSRCGETPKSNLVILDLVIYYIPQGIYVPAPGPARSLWRPTPV